MYKEIPQHLYASEELTKEEKKRKQGSADIPCVPVLPKVTARQQQVNGTGDRGACASHCFPGAAQTGHQLAGSQDCCPSMWWGL